MNIVREYKEKVFEVKAPYVLVKVVRPYKEIHVWYNRHVGQVFVCLPNPRIHLMDTSHIVVGDMTRVLKVDSDDMFPTGDRVYLNTYDEDAEVLHQSLDKPNNWEEYTEEVQCELIRTN
jgi:hypothetical protein